MGQMDLGFGGTSTADDASSPARTRMDELVDELNRHNHLYHVLDAAEIDDRAYDLLFKELLEIEEANPEWLRGDSPSQRVGGVPVDGLEKFPHRVPMLSLSNAFESQDLRDFEDRIRRQLGDTAPETIRFVVEPKSDGLAMELVYENGQLTGAGTRGDGAVGENVTHNMRTVRTVPLALKPPFDAYVSVRGEVIFDLAGFERMNQVRMERGDAAFKNPECRSGDRSTTGP